MSVCGKNCRVALTVDVEAHPIRAAGDHVERLIWGRQQGREAGIATMMDMADRHGAPMTFFLDYPEAELYGEALLDAGREILRRGHDLEPHCHAEYITGPLFGHQDPWALRLPNASLDQSLRVVDWLVRTHERAGGSSPLAHRSGAYLIGPHYLEALRRHGIRIDASYNYLCRGNPFSIGVRAPFLWQNGLWELPVPLIPYFRQQGHIVHWNFNAPCFTTGTPEENVAAHRAFLHSWFKRHGEDAVATLVMHSWSFWRLDSGGFFSIPDERNVETFDALLAMLREEFTVVSLAGLAREGAPAGLESVDMGDTSGHCPVCFEPASHFQDYNAPRRQCPFCRSVERHRTLVDLVYAGAFGPDVFRHKDILHIAPGWAEKLLLRRMAGARVTTLNVLPGCDLTADISAMPQVPDNSFDLVLASEVFRHVRHLDRALAEIARVLRPGGRLLCSDCLEDSDYGREITDLEEQISWYGREKLEQYNIGDFRRFGRKDWAQAFEPYFHTRICEAVDKATGSPAWWLECASRKGAGPGEEVSPACVA